MFNYECFLNYIFAEFLKFEFDPEALLIFFFGFLIGFLVCGLVEVYKFSKIYAEMVRREEEWAKRIDQAENHLKENNSMIKQLTSLLNPESNELATDAPDTELPQTQTETRDTSKESLAEEGNQQNKIIPRTLNFVINTLGKAANSLQQFKHYLGTLLPTPHQSPIDKSAPVNNAAANKTHKRHRSTLETKNDRQQKTLAMGGIDDHDTLVKKTNDDQQKKFIPLTMNFVRNTIAKVIYAFQFLKNFLFGASPIQTSRLQVTPVRKPFPVDSHKEIARGIHTETNSDEEQFDIEFSDGTRIQWKAPSPSVRSVTLLMGDKPTPNSEMQHKKKKQRKAKERKQRRQVTQKRREKRRLKRQRMGQGRIQEIMDMENEESDLE